MMTIIRKIFGGDSAITLGPTTVSESELFIYVRIPGDIQPIARGERFEDPLEAALQENGLGSVSGGGSQLDDPYPDGSPKVEFCGIDIDVTDLDRARAFLHKKLVTLHAPTGTELHYTKGDSKFLDRLTDGVWEEGLSQSDASQ